MLCLDAFPVAAWATKALGRTLVSQLRASGHAEEIRALEGSRWAAAEKFLRT